MFLSSIIFENRDRKTKNLSFSDLKRMTLYPIWLVKVAMVVMCEHFSNHICGVFQHFQIAHIFGMASEKRDFAIFLILEYKVILQVSDLPW